MNRGPNPVALLTDFGGRDWFVATLKAVLLSRNGAIPIVDITHQVPPQDVLAGAFILSQAARWLPEGSVFLCVVDPGVGSERAIVAVEHANRFFVAPDNGLLSLAVPPDARAFVLRDPEAGSPGRTFQGRDVMAPAAARLALGEAPPDLGPALQQPIQRLSVRKWERQPGGALGVIIHFDAFGNAITNIPFAEAFAPGIPGGLMAECGGNAFLFRNHYAEGKPGEGLLVPNSCGLFELAVNGASAAERFGLRRGMEVIVTV